MVSFLGILIVLGVVLGVIITFVSRVHWKEKSLMWEAINGETSEVESNIVSQSTKLCSQSEAKALVEQSTDKVKNTDLGVRCIDKSLMKDFLDAVYALKTVKVESFDERKQDDLKIFISVSSENFETFIEDYNKDGKELSMFDSGKLGNFMETLENFIPEVPDNILEMYSNIVSKASVLITTEKYK